MKGKKLLQAAVAGAFMAGALGSAQALTFNYQAGGGFYNPSDSGFATPTNYYGGGDSVLRPTLYSVLGLVNE